MNRKLRAAIATPLVMAAATGMMGSKLSCGSGQHAATFGVKPIGYLADGTPVIAQPHWRKPPTYVYGPQPTTPPNTGANGRGARNWIWIRLPRTRKGQAVWRKGWLSGS
jgi:hypothetical protein